MVYDEHCNGNAVGIKRIVDIVGAALGLVFALPLIAVIAAAVKFGDGGPVLVGLGRISGGRVVKVYKFRSMVPGAERQKKMLMHLNERTDGPFFKIKNDPRVTPVGRVIRKFRVDEIPQLINVLKGELSLVGPRPHEPEEVAQYPPEYKWIAEAKAGITGMSQVNGASSLPYMKELELDAYYLANRSLWLDVKILARTVLILFTDPTGV